MNINKIIVVAIIIFTKSFQERHRLLVSTYTGLWVMIFSFSSIYLPPLRHKLVYHVYLKFCTIFILGRWFVNVAKDSFRTIFDYWSKILSCILFWPFIGANLGNDRLHCSVAHLCWVYIICFALFCIFLLKFLKLYLHVRTCSCTCALFTILNFNPQWPRCL